MATRTDRCLWERCPGAEADAGGYHPECTRRLIAAQQADYQATGQVRRRRT